MHLDVYGLIQNTEVEAVAAEKIDKHIQTPLLMNGTWLGPTVWREPARSRYIHHHSET